MADQAGGQEPQRSDLQPGAPQPGALQPGALQPGDTYEVPSSSCMTTRELQQNWRAEKKKLRAARLLFEIPSSRVAGGLSKYVAYRVVVMLSGSYDSSHVSVERRYSDFARFHQLLLEEFSEELEDVALPRKLLTGNFNPENILERRVALQDYLAKLYRVRCVRYSCIFVEFFTEPEQRSAHDLLRSGQFRPALELLQMLLAILEKLALRQSPVLLVPTLCALAVCHRDLDEPREALAMAKRALPPVRRYRLKRYRAPLLELMVNLGYELEQPVAQLQEELTLVKDAERGLVSFQSLKEAVVQDFK